MKIVKNATLKNKEVQRLADRAVAPTAKIEFQQLAMRISVASQPVPGWLVGINLVFFDNDSLHRRLFLASRW